jgi:hypothetical protein
MNGEYFDFDKIRQAAKASRNIVSVFLKFFIWSGLHIQNLEAKACKYKD